jgi:hypothetical protein
MVQGMVVYRTTWRLPEGMTCSHCKLQWYYMTAQSCWPPCPAANQDEPTCENKQAFPTCGTPGAAYPEEFWNVRGRNDLQGMLGTGSACAAS